MKNGMSEQNASHSLKERKLILKNEKNAKKNISIGLREVTL